MTSEDYRPIDLSAVANASADLLGDGSQLPTGAQTFRGLPFDLALLLIGGEAGTGSVRIQVGAEATWLLFAHRLIDTSVYQGAPIGGTVAEYVAYYADGSTAVIPIRERFEIAIPDDR